MEVVEFVTEIEQQFAIQFSDRDLQDPRFVTIGGLAELILKCLERSPVTAPDLNSKAVLLHARHSGKRNAS